MVIQQQFSIITQELYNFTNKVSSDLDKISQACTVAQKNTSRLVQDAILQDLAKPQDSTPIRANPPREPRNLNLNQVPNSLNNVNITTSLQMDDFDVAPHLDRDACHSQVPQKTATFPHKHVNQQRPNPAPIDFNQSIVELFQCQIELTPSTQCLHQQTTYALQNIIRSSNSQENQYFIKDILIFKAKDPQSFDDWLEQIEKVAELTNKDLYKLALAKSQGSFDRKISSFLHSMAWNKIKERLCYHFGSVATKQHATSMLINQQQEPSETLQEYVHRFSDLLLKSSSLLPHQGKDLAHITHFIHNLHKQKTTALCARQKPNFSTECHNPNTEEG